MTEQTNAELIDKLRIFAGEMQNPRASLMRDAADALEAADQKVAEYAAVVEKVRVYAESIPRTRDRDVNPGLSKRSWLTAQDVLDILDDTPADALREVKADVWDEGVNAEARAAVTASPRIKNPYRREL